MTACGQVYNDMHGGPLMRCGRSLGHGGPHDPMSMPAVLRYLAPPPVSFAWTLSTIDADLIDRALVTMHRDLWGARKGQSAEVLRERDRIAALRGERSRACYGRAVTGPALAPDDDYPESAWADADDDDPTDAPAPHRGGHRHRPSRSFREKMIEAGLDPELAQRWAQKREPDAEDA